MSRQKTYIHEFDQLWRSLELAINNCDGFLKLKVAVVYKNTRFFLAGDIVFVDWFHGQADRFPVYGVSRKGRNVADLFMVCQRWDNDCHKRYSGSVNVVPNQGFNDLYSEVKTALQSLDSGVALQAIIASLRAGSPVSPVGTCNRTSI